MAEKKNYLPISVCISGKCDRNCTHCSADANMKGPILSIENAMILARELRRTTSVVRDKLNANFRLDFTGNGELLIHPQIIDIFDTIFGLNPNVVGGIVTSGVNPKSPDEENRLRILLSRPYINRLSFSVSFNLFQKGFSKRLIRTLKILFENGVESATIKICQPNEKVFNSIYRLDWLLKNYFIRWTKKVNPLVDRSKTLYPVNLQNELKDAIEYFCQIDLGCNPSEVIDAVSSWMIDIRNPSEEKLVIYNILIQTQFRQSFAFMTEFGQRRITYMPHYLIKKGRARQLRDTGWPPDAHKRLCHYLRQDDTNSSLHLGADGYYYPNVSCPQVEALRLGHVKDDIRQVLYYFIHSRRELFNQVIMDKTPDDNICGHCVQVASRIKLTSFQ